MSVVCFNPCLLDSVVNLSLLVIYFLVFDIKGRNRSDHIFLLTESKLSQYIES